MHVSDAFRRTARTIVQGAVGLAAALPLLVDAANVSSTLPGLGTALAVSGVVTRVMASPLVDRFLPAWLRAAPTQLPDATLPAPASE